MAVRKIFIDASVIYAFIDRADPNHLQISKVIEQLSLQGVSLFTAFHSVQDAYAAINRQMGTTVGSEFLQVMTESSIEILYPQKNDFNAAVKLIKLNRNRPFSFKEAISAILMQKKGVGRILTLNVWQNLLGTESYFASRV